VAPSSSKVVDVVPTGQVTVDVDASGQEVREAESRPEPNIGHEPPVGKDQEVKELQEASGPSPVEASDTTRPRFKSRYFPNGGGEQPVVEMDESDEDMSGPVEREDERRRATREIEDLLNDLDDLDILDEGDD
jgi:hypothetical protein